MKDLARSATLLIHCLQPYLSLSFFTSFGRSYLHRTENMSPPSLVASHRFLITATLRHSHVNFASRFVWRARPIPSRTMRSTPWDDIAFAKSRFSRLESKNFISLFSKYNQFHSLYFTQVIQCNGKEEQQNSKPTDKKENTWNMKTQQQKSCHCYLIL